MDERDAALRRAAELGLQHLAGLPERHVGATADATALAARLGGPLPERGTDPVASSRRWPMRSSRASWPAGRATSASSSAARCRPRVAADWLAAAWDQNAVLHATSPAAAAAEQVAGDWMLDLLGLPADASFGLHRRPGLGNVGRAGGRAPCGPRARRLGRRGAWAVRRPPRSRSSSATRRTRR